MAALRQQFHAMHLFLGAASAMVSAPLSPEGAAKIFRCAERLVPGDGSRSRKLQRIGVLAGWDDGVCALIRDGIVAVARGVGAVRGDRPYLHIGGDLTQQLGQHWRITDVTSGDLDNPNLQRRLIDADV
jgi:hypothetical protein